VDVHILGWIGLAAIILTLIAIDIVGHVRTPHEPTMKEAAVWSVAYITMALVFGAIVWFVWGGGFAREYLAGYITEKALSIDNLFVFVIMMSSFLAGAALIENFSWVFYFFGAWLLWTAFSQAREGVEEPDDEDEEYKPSGFVKLIARVIPMTDGFVGGKVIHRHAGRTMITPMMLCIIAIGTADVMFAVDSIPAIYSLTNEPFLVFSANALSLLGLRQLYFLIDGLLDRLIYLHYGLAVILGFIGFKLIVHALHTNEVFFINGGQEWHGIPEASIEVSLAVIITTVLITVIASVLKSRADARRAEVAS